MNRAIVGLPFLGLVAGLLLLGASCGPSAEPAKVPSVAVVTPPVPPASASGSAGSQGSKGSDNPAELEVTSWTDDEAIQALAKDCHWDPGGCVKAIETIALQSMDSIDFAPENGQAVSDESRPLPAAACKGLRGLACSQVPGQSCAPDGCSQSDYDCVPECDKTCTGCADKCVTGCEACKSTCKDEACRLTCAKSCGECRQSCLQALDHCASAECSDKQEACFKERDDAWMKTACPKVCPKVQSCVEKCPEVENDYTGDGRYRTPCARKCLSTLGKGCPSRFDTFCLGEPSGSINFYSYHNAHHPDGK